MLRDLRRSRVASGSGTSDEIRTCASRSERPAPCQRVGDQDRGVDVQVQLGRQIRPGAGCSCTSSGALARPARNRRQVRLAHPVGGPATRWASTRPGRTGRADTAAPFRSLIESAPSGMAGQISEPHPGGGSAPPRTWHQRRVRGVDQPAEPGHLTRPLSPGVGDHHLPVRGHPHPCQPVAALHLERAFPYGRWELSTTPILPYGKGTFRASASLNSPEP